MLDEKKVLNEMDREQLSIQKLFILPHESEIFCIR